MRSTADHGKLYSEHVFILLDTRKKPYKKLSQQGLNTILLTFHVRTLIKHGLSTFTASLSSRPIITHLSLRWYGKALLLSGCSCSGSSTAVKQTSRMLTFSCWYKRVDGRCLTVRAGRFIQRHQTLRQSGYCRQQV